MRPRNHTLSVRLGSLIIVLLLTFILAVPALAVHFILDTDDGQIDPHWYPTAYIIDPQGDADNTAFDILGGWIEVDSDTPDEFAFRMKLSSPIIPGGVLTARLDCNNDQDFVDIQDKIVHYDFTSDEVTVLDGDEATGQADILGETYGEWIAPGDYEWKAVVTTGDEEKPDWTDCLSAPIQIKFETNQLQDPGPMVNFDTTSIRVFDAPAAVMLVKFQAHAAGYQIKFFLLVIVLLFVVILFRTSHWVRSLHL